MPDRKKYTPPLTGMAKFRAELADIVKTFGNQLSIAKRYSPILGITRKSLVRYYESFVAKTKSLHDSLSNNSLDITDFDRKIALDVLDKIEHRLTKSYNALVERFGLKKE